MIIDIPYYQDVNRISNSNIGWFLTKGPYYLYRMLTGKEEGETGAQLDRGTMIHEYILQPEEFWNDYQMLSFKKPSSPNQNTFCNELVNSTEIEPNKALCEAFKKAYSTTNKQDDYILSEATKLASTLKDYITWLKDPEQKKLVSQYDRKMLDNIYTNIQEHKLAKQLVEQKQEDGVYAYHEFHINWDWVNEETGDTVKCKSLLDSCTFDTIHKKCIIMDLKTTVKIGHFEDSVNTYDYTRQLMFYTMAAKWYIQNEIKENPNDYEFEWYIIGIDTLSTNEIRVFKFTKDQIEKSKPVIDTALTQISWHQQNNKWNHHIEYYLNDGAEMLNL